GEPLTRSDLFHLASYAGSKGLKYVLSTNGTLISKSTAQNIKKTGFSYVGISLDGMEKTNDFFRGRKGAFTDALRGLENCTEINQRVGLRLTLTKHTLKDLHKIFDLIESHNIHRACFYHLVPSGRGKNILNTNLTREETRTALDIILERTKDFISRGLRKDILTVDNHSDGVYIYLKLKKEDEKKARKTLELLKINGGAHHSSGVGIGCIDYKGDVHPDQFWQDCSFGNVKEKPFNKIWTDLDNPLMKGLKNRAANLKGRCSSCGWVNLCGGGMRVRAERASGDPWAEDPACCLTDEEIKLSRAGTLTVEA
ncbi:MAG: radical SAM protein, partial [Armatimonadota bacterium]